MRSISVLGVAIALSISGTAAVCPPARADNGQVAAGLLGGLAVGTLFGAAVAQPRYYAPAPVYVVPPPSCYWTRKACLGRISGHLDPSANSGVRLTRGAPMEHRTTPPRID